jgi:hypothetical protein
MKKADQQWRERAHQKALEMGATAEKIEAEVARQRRQKGTMASAMMIRALKMHTHLNSVSDWMRLHGALVAWS